jgi:hypothetical protein
MKLGKVLRVLVVEPIRTPVANVRPAPSGAAKKPSLRPR